MQHINLSNYKGSITDWTELNYINGGLADNLADITNIKVNDSCYNYLAKSGNLIALDDEERTTGIGITYKIENDRITLNGTTTGGSFQIKLKNNIKVATSTLAVFNSTAIPTMNMSVRDVNNTAIDFVVFDSVNAKKTITTTSEIGYIGFYFGSNLTFNNYTIKPMLIKGSTAPTAYEPYGALVIHQNAVKIPFTNLDFTRISTLEQGVFRAELTGLGIKVPEPRAIPNSYIKGYIPYPWNPLSENDDGKYGYGIRASSQKLTLAIVDKNYINNLNGFIQANINNNFIAELATPQIIVLKSVDLGTLDYTLSISNRRYLYKTTINDIKGQVDTNQKIVASSSVYNAVSTNKPWVDKDMAYSETAIGSKSVTFVNNDYTTVAAFKAAMKGVILLYEPKE